MEMEVKEVSSQLLATYRWRFNNEDRWKELCKINMKKYRDTNPNYPEKKKINDKTYYERNKERILQKKKEYYKRKNDINTSAL
jgi:hypothetical protein